MADKKQINECYSEAKSGWQDWLTEADEDFRFYFGDGWDAKSRAEARRKGIPDLDINKIAKQVDSASGFQRINAADIKVYPIEGADESLCEILTKTTKWILSNGNGYNAISKAYDDALICGMGYVSLDFNYDKDIINGNIRFKNEAPFNILPSPYFTEPDLSDCPYIIRHKLVDQDELMRLYPDYKKDIKSLKTGIDNDGIRRFIDVPSNRGKQLMVVEYYQRVYEPKKIIVNTTNPADSTIWKGDKTRLQLLMRENPHFALVETTLPAIKLTTMIGDDLVVYDDYSPFPVNMYPFFPVMGYYNSSFDEWKLKLKGLVRPLKPLQKEKNKRRSSIMQAISTMPNSGYMFEHGAIDDLKDLRNAGGASKYIAVNRLDKIQQIQPPNFPAGLAQLEQMSDRDFDDIGVNTALLGQLATNRESASLFNMRRQQSLATLQQLQDNLTVSIQMLGNTLIEIIGKKFSSYKIQRIVGDEMQVPENFEQLVQGAQFDCQVDLISNSPTHRYSVANQIKELKQYGIPIPPELAVEYLDIPIDLKKKTITQIQQMQQAQMMTQQPQAQLPSPEMLDEAQNY